MTKSLKAALLSGLVFPGAGQILLRRYGRGILIMVCVLAAVAVLVVTAARTATVMLRQLEMQGEVIDLDTLVRLAVEASHSTAPTYAGSIIWIVFCWVFSVIDAYRIGRALGQPDRHGSLRTLG